MSAEDVFSKVRAIIADVLVIDEDEIKPTSRLIADLGAESIDFLDLVFQLEKTFAIKIPRGQLEKNARGSLTEEEFATSGVVSARGLDVLKTHFSEVPATYFKDGMKVSEIPMLFTVETFCKVVAAAKQQSTATVV